MSRYVYPSTFRSVIRSAGKIVVNIIVERNRLYIVIQVQVARDDSRVVAMKTLNNLLDRR